MTIEEIRVRRAELVERRQFANDELQRVRLESQILSTYCSHPNAYSYTAMGDPGRKCDDCGWQT